MITPGSSSPLMWGQGDPLDEYGKVERALRFRQAASAYLSRTFVAGNRLKWTWFGWIKASALASVDFHLFTAGSNGSNDSALYLNASTSWALSWINRGASTLNSQKTSSRLVRDPGAHLFVQMDWDSANATASERVRLYINGERITAFSVDSGPSLNQQSIVNSAVTHYIGKQTTVGQYTDGICSLVGFVDGDNPAPTALGRVNPTTGQWRAKSKTVLKAVVDAGGANSFLLSFDDLTNTTTLCADASANGNNWTANNISLTLGTTYDSVVDTPTNNYVGLNPLDVSPTGAVTNGGLAFNSQGAGSYSMVRASMPVGAGGLKTYYEFIVPATQSYAQFGFLRGDLRLINGGSSNLIASSYPDSIGYWVSNGDVYGSGSVSLAVGPTPAPGDVVMLAHDPATNKVWFGLNGAWLNSGDPAAGTGEVATLSSAYQWHVAMCDAATQDVHYMFGQAPLHASAAWHAEARGYFRYAPPSGFKALCTKNLPAKPAVVRATDAFVAKTDSGANIVAAVAAAAPWTDWLRIYKRRDAAEGWRWQFSDDPGNYLDSSSTAAKAAFPALAGASYVAYALKVSAANGVATGRLNHVNGVTSVVADNLGKSRKLVILKNEATGVWFVYHPELTAGKLLYLNSTAAETTDNAINTVTANDFKVASALASGTYRWVAIAEVEGFTKLGKYLGNGAANGAMNVAGLAPSLTFIKNSIGAVVNWMSYDTTMSQGNPAGYLSPSLTNAEASDVPVDVVSNGLKMRSTSTNINQGGSTYVTLSIAAFPFRYANAR